MHNPLIKICGIRSPELAQHAALAGADFIGIVFHPTSKRHVDIEHAKEIASATLEKNALPVAVFVEQSAQQMREICECCNINVIQLHGTEARKQHHLLSHHYKRFYVQSVSTNGLSENDFDGGLVHCEAQRDYVLFDNVQAGKGKTFDWDNFTYHGPFRFCLAGGLTPRNVAVAIKKLQPDLVDVSSGVEGLSGEKEVGLIVDFIHAVRGVCDGE